MAIPRRRAGLSGLAATASVLLAATLAGPATAAAAAPASFGGTFTLSWLHS